jgi:competence protein ComEA
MSTPGKIDINAAHVVQLNAVKGIGKSRAEAIVRYRDKNGPFGSLDDLDRVPHVGDMPPGELDRVKTQLTVRVSADMAPPTAPEPEKVDINVANVEELRTVEGIGSERAQEIIQYREEHGPIRDLAELDDLPHFRDEPEGQRQPIKARLKV